MLPRRPSSDHLYSVSFFKNTANLGLEMNMEQGLDR